jgi:hypothetical protein
MSARGRRSAEDQWRLIVDGAPRAAPIPRPWRKMRRAHTAKSGLHPCCHLQSLGSLSLPAHWPAGSYGNARRERDPLWPSMSKYPCIAAWEGKEGVLGETMTRRELAPAGSARLSRWPRRGGDPCTATYPEQLPLHARSVPVGGQAASSSARPVVEVRLDAMVRASIRATERRSGDHADLRRGHGLERRGRVAP